MCVCKFSVRNCFQVMNDIVETERAYVNDLQVRINTFSNGCTCCNDCELSVIVYMYMYTVEPLYCGHHWDPSSCPDCRGVINSVVLYRIATFGTQESVHVSKVSRGVHIEGLHCIDRCHFLTPYLYFYHCRLSCQFIWYLLKLPVCK